MPDNRKFNKWCVVCGDKASNYNFGAITCVSCKAFFRRNAHRIDKLKCNFSNNCNVNVLTRKFCPKCRLNKCFTLGMKTDLILAEHQKKLQKNKTNEKLKSKLSFNLNDESDDCLTDNTSTEESDKTNDYSNDKESDSQSSDNSLVNENIDIKSLICQTLNVFSLPVLRPLTDYSNNLNEIEGKQLNELLFAANFIRFTINSNVVYVINDINMYTEYITNVYTQGVQTFFCLTNNLQTFNQLCETDKISLVKYGAIEILSVRSLETFNYEHQYWTINIDETQSVLLPLEYIKDLVNTPYEAYKTFFNIIIPEINSDSVTLDLLSAILLFNPNRPNIVHKHFVKLQQNKYIYLLQRYFQLKYRSPSEANKKLMNLFKLLPIINRISRIMRQNGIQTPSCILGPLLSEIYDHTIA
ncbi:nuclear hormone receptor HR96-like [Oppia nitens]|uniref:nuclear hormone receptor HR96-like n=1 Tax=Oppia nitens TaxID=1686743 RepID=UPI0023DA3D82|nr:nuclear hormone receptor HR96-like [Oppia nitens]